MEHAEPWHSPSLDWPLTTCPQGLAFVLYDSFIYAYEATKLRVCPKVVPTWSLHNKQATCGWSSRFMSILCFSPFNLWKNLCWHNLVKDWTPFCLVNLSMNASHTNLRQLSYLTSYDPNQVRSICSAQCRLCPIGMGRPWMRMNRCENDFMNRAKERGIRASTKYWRGLKRLAGLISNQTVNWQTANSPDVNTSSFHPVTRTKRMKFN